MTHSALTAVSRSSPDRLEINIVTLDYFNDALREKIRGKREDRGWRTYTDFSRTYHNIRKRSAIVKELKAQAARAMANASLYPSSRIAKAPTSRKLASTRAMSSSLTTAFLPVRTCAPSCFHSHLPAIRQRSSENRSTRKTRAMSLYRVKVRRWDRDLSYVPFDD